MRGGGEGAKGRRSPQRSGGPRCDVLIRFKRAVLAGRVIFTDKANAELEADHLEPYYVCEAIICAPSIYKTLRSISALGGVEVERLYVIIGVTYGGVPI